jgi:hypothetical protein
MAAGAKQRILVGREAAGDDAKQRPGRQFRPLKLDKEGTDVATDRTRTNGTTSEKPQGGRDHHDDHDHGRRI